MPLSLLEFSSPPRFLSSQQALVKPTQLLNQVLDFTNVGHLIRLRMRYFFEDVPKLGNVALSRHPQDQMAKAAITDQLFERVLFHPLKSDILQTGEILWRERDGIRIVI